MAYRNKKYGKRRVWLNTAQDQLACVAWDVARSGYSDDLEKDSIDANLVIRDCSRAVTLEFFCEASDFPEKLKKINKLLKEVTLFRAALLKAKGNE